MSSDGLPDSRRQLEAALSVVEQTIAAWQRLIQVRLAHANHIERKVDRFCRGLDPTPWAGQKAPPTEAERPPMLTQSVLGLLPSDVIDKLQEQSDKLGQIEWEIEALAGSDHRNEVNTLRRFINKVREAATHKQWVVWAFDQLRQRLMAKLDQLDAAPDGTRRSETSESWIHPEKTEVPAKFHFDGNPKQPPIGPITGDKTLLGFAVSGEVVGRKALWERLERKAVNEVIFLRRVSSRRLELFYSHTRISDFHVAEQRCKTGAKEKPWTKFSG